MPDEPSTFEELSLSEPVHRALNDLGFTTPTEVQISSYGPICEGKDVMVQARTGTGKTAAFGIPLADRLLSPDQGVQLLALCPTRELAIQVADELSAIGRHKGLVVAPVYGGAAIGKQIEQLEQGVHSVVGTPGRVLDHIRRGTLQLDGIRFLVLDEADEMLSMGFEKEISAIIEQLPTKRQSMAFSATIPASVRRLAQKYMSDPILISLSDDYVGAKEIQHAFYMVSGTGRLADLVRIIDAEDPDSAMVFCNTRDDVQLVAAGLKRHGFSVDWISSDLSQAEREKAMGRMKKGGTRFLVATDVAARGIDISHVTHVINYTFPESLDVYIHRTGRTGRMGKTGYAVSLVTPRDVGNLYFLKLTYHIEPVERDLPTDGELQARKEADLLRLLLDEWREPLDEPYLALASRLFHHVRGTEVVATLLRRALEPQSAEDAQAARRARQGEPKKPATEAPKRRTRTRARKARPDEASEADDDGAPGTPEDSPSTRDVDETDGPTSAPTSSPPADGQSADAQPPEDEGAPPFKEVYVSAGRRDGLRAEDVTRLLGEGGVDEALIDSIRIRDRSTFVAVHADHAEAALRALDGQDVGGREIRAEPAKKARQ